MRSDSRARNLLPGEQGIPPSHVRIHHSLILLLLTQLDIPDRLARLDAFTMR